MSKLITGGPAFPNSDASYIHRVGAAAMVGIEDTDQRDSAYIKATAEAAQGMTVRDYFAAKALQGLCANPGGPFQANGRSGWTIVNCTVEQIAEEAYGLADAMLKAKEVL